MGTEFLHLSRLQVTFCEKNGHQAVPAQIERHNRRKKDFRTLAAPCRAHSSSTINFCPCAKHENLVIRWLSALEVHHSKKRYRRSQRLISSTEKNATQCPQVIRERTHCAKRHFDTGSKQTNLDKTWASGASTESVRTTRCHVCVNSSAL
uniref:Uncharacterized protein n=1 Tax=Hyaloperonospora arabidopsidis (strain Emoy2) TaxID=559515 RepID=M4BMI0_HYAAE